MRPVIAIWLASIFLLAGLIQWNTVRDRSACGAKAARIENSDYRYGYFSGCAIAIGDKWYDGDRLYLTDDGRVLVIAGGEVRA